MEPNATPPPLPGDAPPAVLGELVVGNGRLIAESIAGSKLVMLPYASHIYMTDQPEASHKAVLDFLLGRKEVGVPG